MPPQFDKWVRSTLRPRHDVEPQPGEIRRIVAGLRPWRMRRYRVALTAGLAVVVVGFVLLADPGKIGSDTGRFEITRRLDDGRLVIQQPLTGSGTVVKTPEEIEDWNRVFERTAAGEEKIVGYVFYRYHGRATWTVGYKQIDENGVEQVIGRQPTYGPAERLSMAARRKVVPYFDALATAAKAGQAIVCPPERHEVDGVPVDFEVWAMDIPGVGRLEYGYGLPPVP